MSNLRYVASFVLLVRKYAQLPILQQFQQTNKTDVIDILKSKIDNAIYMDTYGRNVNLTSQTPDICFRVGGIRSEADGLKG